MRGLLSALVVVLLISALIPLGLTSPASTVPAFLWASHQYDSSKFGMKDTVNYRTIAPKDLAKVVLSEGGWSNLLCPVKDRQPLDVALVFVGRELQSSDIAGNKQIDRTLVHLLKDSFTKSNFSMAFPYVALSEEKGAIESSLISGFTESCGNSVGLNNIAFLGSCSVESENLIKLTDTRSVHDYLSARMEKKTKGQADVIMFCKGDDHSLEGLDQTQSEGKIFSELLSSVEQLGATYTVLYASDPYRSTEYPSYRDLDRFLAEGKYGNSSANDATFCDGICQIKSTLLEGVLVAITLLIILISGLCCMMGIDTPMRFEAPQDT